MTLNQITKVKGPGIHTLANIVSNSISLGGIATASNFKTGTTNVHNVGVEAAGINVLGADTPIGTGATIYDAGGAVFTGVVTATSFSGTSSLASGLTDTPDIAVRNITGVGATFTGNVSIGGTLTYEDVTNIDSVGIITARDGLKVLAGGANVVGVVTATSFVGGLPITNGADNRVITASSASAIQGEANLTYDGTTLNNESGSGAANLVLKSTVDSFNSLILDSNRSADTQFAIIDGRWNGNVVNRIQFVSGSDGTNKDDGYMAFHTRTSGESLTERLTITSAGKVGIGSDIPTSQLDIKRANVSSMPNGNAKPSGASIFNDGGDIFTGRLFWQGTARGASSDFLTGINNEGNVLVMYDYSNTKYMQKWHKNAQVELYHNNQLKLNTRTDGVKITGGTDMSMDSNGTGQLYMTGNGYTGGIALDATAMNIYHNSGSRAIIFGTNETEKLRITSGGSVNIGGDYTQTSKKFKVTGNSTFDGGISFGGVLEGSGFSVASGNVTIPAYIYHDSDSDTFFGFPSADKISFSTGATGSSVEYLRLHRYASVNFVEAGANAHISLADNGTNIRGILIGDGNASSTGGLRLQAGGGSSGFGGGIVMYSHANSDNPGGVYIGKSVGATGSIIFGNSGTGNVSASNEFARIASDGNVGINQNNPNKAKLHVVSDTGVTNRIVAKFRNPHSDSDVKAKIGLVCGYSDTANDTEGQAYIGAQRESNGNNAALFFETSDGTTLSESLRITSNGAVGIGTVTPDAACDNRPGLHIHSNHNDSCRLNLTTPTKDNTRIGYFGLNRFGMDVCHGFQIRDSKVSYATRLLIDSSGRSGFYQDNGSTNNAYAIVSEFNAKTSGSAAANFGPALYLTHTFGGTNYAGSLITSQTDADVNTTHISFYPRNYGWIERLRIASNGQVRMNTAGSPQADLHVGGTGAALNAYFVTSRSSGAYHHYALGQSGASLGYIGSSQQISSAGQADGFAFRSEGHIELCTGGSTEQVRLTSTGRMGLGISAPEAVLHPRANPAHGTDTAFQVGTGNRYFKLIELSGQDNFGQCYMSFHDNSLREILTLENTYAGQTGMGMEICFRGLSSGKTGHVQAYNTSVNSGQSELALGASGGTALRINHDKIITFDGKLRANNGVDNSNGNSNKIASGHCMEWGSGNMSGGLATGWYPIIHLTDGCYMVLLKTGAHSSILFTASNGYDPSNVSYINVLHYTNNRNGSYLNVDGLRNTSNGIIEVHLTASSSDYFYMEAQILGAENIDNSLMFYNTLTKNTGSPTVNDTKYPLTYGTGGMQLENVRIDGALDTGGSKNFRIPHPLSSLTGTKDLVHAAVEGPRADLIYRDNVDLVGGTATVNIDTVTGMTAGTFVALTKNAQCFTTNETGWTNVKGSISGNTLTITAQDNSCTDNISWMVVAQRKDANIISASATDSNGDLILEPPSPLVDTSGQAPDNSMV